MQILNETSSQDVVSWRGHKIRLHCNVRVVPNTHTSFVWRNKAKGGTIVDPSKQRDHVTSSLLRIVTYTDDEFGPYECVAMTTATNYTHEIRIKRLCKYIYTYILYNRFRMSGKYSYGSCRAVTVPCLSVLIG